MREIPGKSGRVGNSGICLWQKFFLNRTLAIDLPFQTFAIDLPFQTFAIDLPFQTFAIDLPFQAFAVGLLVEFIDWFSSTAFSINTFLVE